MSERSVPVSKTAKCAMLFWGFFKIAALVVGGGYAIVPAAENHPYQTPEFVSLDGKIYRNGQLIFNRKFVSFKNDAGLQRIEWDQIPSGEIRKILKYYVAIREKRDHAAVEPKRQQELAAAYVRYAMFCQWYGMYEEAQNYAIRTLKYLPGNSTNKLITQWLLQ